MNTNFTLFRSYSFHKSSYHKSCGVVVVVVVVLGGLFRFGRHSTQEPASGRVTYFILGPTQEPCVSHSQHRGKQNGRGLEKKMQVNGPEV